jgi:hypothetical protein
VGRNRAAPASSASVVARVCSATQADVGQRREKLALTADKPRMRIEYSSDIVRRHSVRSLSANRSQCDPSSCSDWGSTQVQRGESDTLMQRRHDRGDSIGCPFVKASASFLNVGSVRTKVRCEHEVGSSRQYWQQIRSSLSERRRQADSLERLQTVIRSQHLLHHFTVRSYICRLPLQPNALLSDAQTFRCVSSRWLHDQ